jgi:hypothetical protein
MTGRRRNTGPGPSRPPEAPRPKPPRHPGDVRPFAGKLVVLPADHVALTEADAAAATHALAALLAPLLHHSSGAPGPCGGLTGEPASQPDATMGPGT